ncbi:hypothetical protein GCM10020229_45850 [Kitasatospora albolonga]|uniref:phage major capsid protein n=1 Tax=Kitasatospora albolonga TaxID=68173 RepID=UPI0031EE7ECF
MAINPKSQARPDNPVVLPETRIATMLHEHIVGGSDFFGLFSRQDISTQSVKLLVGTKVTRAGVVGEGETIPSKKDTASEVECAPVKYGEMGRLTQENIDDSNPSVLERRVRRIADAITLGADDDFLNAAKPESGKENSSPNAGILLGVESAGEIKDNLDAVKDAKAAIRLARGTASVFIVHPTSANALRKIKRKLADGTDSNEYLLQGDTIADGLRVVESEHMKAGLALIADTGAATVVVRKATEVKLLTELYAETDEIGCRGTFRAGWLVTNADQLRTVKVPTK